MIFEGIFRIIDVHGCIPNKLYELFAFYIACFGLVVSFFIVTLTIPEAFSVPVKRSTSTFATT